MLLFYTLPKYSLKGTETKPLFFLFKFESQIFLIKINMSIFLNSKLIKYKIS